MHWENGHGINTNLIKCLKVYCENKNIPLKITPARLRDIILHWINHGYSNDQILELMVKNELNINHSADTRISLEKTKYLPFAYNTLAMIIKEITKEMDKGFNTNIMVNLVPNSQIITGKSKNGVDHAEHIVPRVLIRDQASKMFKEGAEIKEVAKMIEENLKVVLITKGEAKDLDHKLKLKTKMPNGWNFGDSIFARLVEAKIEFTVERDKED